jgi:phage tail sheath gpL-like
VKLASDATRVRAGRNVVTPKVIRAELIAQYRQLEDEGFVQNGDAFAQQVVVEKDAQNPNRVNVLWPGTLINQLRIFATLIQFRLN